MTASGARFWDRFDQAPGIYRAAVDAQFASAPIRASRRIDVRPKRFATRRLRVDPDFVDPPEEVRARIAEEADLLGRVYAGAATERLWSEPFTRPVAAVANSRFGALSVFNGQPRGRHGGADFAAAAGTPIEAPNAGRIAVARNLYLSGNTIVIDHGLGMFSSLAHLSRMAVIEGDAVAAGQVVGLVGATGRVTGPHLHWAIRVSGARVDPLSVLALLGPKQRPRARDGLCMNAFVTGATGMLGNNLVRALVAEGHTSGRS